MVGPAAHVILVLGYSHPATVSIDLHPTCKARVEKAKKILKKDQNSVVILSGKGASNVSEAHLMHKYLQSHLAERLFILEDQSMTTVENFSKNLEWILENNIRQVTVITSWWHTPRAVRIAKEIFHEHGIQVMTKHTWRGPISFKHIHTEIRVHMDHTIKKIRK